tara:strand:+ start:52 stop:303 length:252 start_codon:yes stop_codon:yes gene_type:complete
MPGFFGLNPKDRKYIFKQVFELVYHGGGGFSHTEVYNMPLWMRRAYSHYISDFHKEKQAAIDKQQLEQKAPDNTIHKPDINPR